MIVVITVIRVEIWCLSVTDHCLGSLRFFSLCHKHNVLNCDQGFLVAEKIESRVSFKQCRRLFSWQST